MTIREHYPAGVPCWVDLVQADLDATTAFYRGLFGWTVDLRTPPHLPSSYSYASTADGTVAGIGWPPGPTTPSGWTSYVRVASADESAAAVEAHGGTVVEPPADVGPSGRVVACADPEGARFGLWQPGELAGAQVVNAPGSWNFSELNSADLDGARRFYGAVFGWELGTFGPAADDDGGFFRLPGYGDVLAAADPAVGELHASGQIPDGFADAVAVLQPLVAGATEPVPHWSTTFGVADADASFARAVELGAEVLAAPADAPYTRRSTVRDPQGAAFTLSEYRPG